MAVAAKDYIGRVLSGYRLVALLGAGGAGAVFLAERVDDPSIQRAIKILLPDDDLPAPELAAFQTRFLREAQAVSQLRHAHILPILSYHAEASGLSYMELPLMSGGTLAGKMAAGPLPLEDVASYLRQIASALDYAHKQGVIHRDVKGANVLLDRDGTPLLADFGIARIFERGVSQPLDTTSARALTRTGQVIGTPACMAPEQLTGGATTPQLDIYALGVLAWQMVTGALPFTASDPLRLALQHLNNPPPSARRLRQELSEPADAALRRALAKRPEDRFASAGTFAAAFEDGLSGVWHPALSLPAATNHALDTTLSDAASALEGLEGTNSAYADPRTRVATRKLPESRQSREEGAGNAGTGSRRHLTRVMRTGLLALALVVIVIGGVLSAPRLLPALSGLVSSAAPGATALPTSSSAANVFKPLVAAGKTLYTTGAPGQCDTRGATWFTNVEGQQQHCLSGGTVLTGANCACPLALAKLESLPDGAFPQNYVIQAQIQSIGISRTDYFGFKFREQAATPEAITFGGYGFLVDANGQWEFNTYDSVDGHKTTLQDGELPTTLDQPHTYDLIVNGGAFNFAIDGKVVATVGDTTYSGGVLDFAAEPRCVIFISNIALYALP
jgi:serine/threonine protein kinase